MRRMGGMRGTRIRLRIRFWFGQQIRFALLLFIVIAVCILEVNIIYTYQNLEDIDKFRTISIDQNLWQELEEECGEKTPEFYEELTIRMLQTGFSPVSKKRNLPGFFYKTGILKSKYIEYKKMYQTILKDIECFPVAEDVKGGETTGFDDSWGGARTYGGKRKHEGTDIMTSNNKRGYFPVISMTDGVVEKQGWLPKGGYRIGIRSPEGGYYYYAHLHSYAKGMHEGRTVRKGQMLGMMGDTGYSEIEGTVGNFDVHLHVGIYLDYMGQEMSVNPYYILKYYEDKKVKFCFKNE